MRLLHTSKLVFQEFFDRDIPDYAILSHRWTADEVSYEDFLTNTKTTSSGYKKIKMCCERATSQHIEWVWIDTCCIDKKSSAELSEAINSMYRWYRNASICYAYLSDVLMLRGTSDLVIDPAWQESFCKSSWFTRGWTLQELIAPGTVRFFDQNWIQIGTRETLAHQIADITKIALQVLLYPFRIHQYTIAQKLSWASNRSTSRIEDTAYCLLGLLDINMPLLYGEGAEAFVRLQREIIRTSDDESIFTWNYRSFEGPFTLLAPSPRYFEDCGDVQNRDIYRRQSYSITNRGLRMTVPLLPYRREISDMYVPLNCTKDGKIPIGLHVFTPRISDFDKRFRRIRCVDLKTAGFDVNGLSSLANRDMVEVEIALGQHLR